jgi:hypothetical protein
MATITKRLWKRLLPGGPWTPATVHELRVLSNFFFKPKGWTLDERDTEILLRRMQTHSPIHTLEQWEFFWGDPQLRLFDDPPARYHDLAPLLPVRDRIPELAGAGEE